MAAFKIEKIICVLMLSLALTACETGFTSQEMPLANNARIPYTVPSVSQNANVAQTNDANTIVYVPMYVDAKTGARVPVVPTAKPESPLAEAELPKTYEVVQAQPVYAYAPRVAGHNGW